MQREEESQSTNKISFETYLVEDVPKNRKVLYVSRTVCFEKIISKNLFYNLFHASQKLFQNFILKILENLFQKNCRTYNLEVPFRENKLIIL